ncbi:M20 family metallopeptidase [Streptomyces sp. NPDC004082]
MNAATRQQELTADLLDLACSHSSRYLADLRELVSIDSGSYDPEGVNRVADWVQERLQRIGFSVERVRCAAVGAAQAGDALVARRKGTLPAEEGGRRILLAGHMDTVFDRGTALARPFTLQGSIAHGPGVSDDKGGLLAGLTALEILGEAGWTAYDELVLIATPDEEIGSPASRPLIERTARGMHYGLGLECARENGDVVIGRKGVADFHITVTGRAAHAGIEPERGANAGLAAAHLIVELQALNGRWDDVTVNVGTIRAGERPNIVCADAELRVEVRATSIADVRRVKRAIQEAADRPAVAGTSITVDQLDLCPPMEATSASRHMLDLARHAAQAVGVRLEATTTGGVGDANLIAGAGVPTLDGLGPVGGADHTPEEWLDITSVPQRITVLAALVAALGHVAAPSL